MQVNYGHKGTVEDEWTSIFSQLPADMREELGFHLGYVDHHHHQRKNKKGFDSLGGDEQSKFALRKVPFCQNLGHSDIVRLTTSLKYIRQQPPPLNENGKADRAFFFMQQHSREVRNTV